MSRYDSALWDVARYDSSPAATSLGDVAISATQVTETAIRVEWRNPTGTHVARRIVRSTLGVPPDPVSGQCMTLVQVDATNSADPNTNTTSYMDSWIAGSELFYALFAQVVDPDNPAALRWILAASTRVSMVKDHNSFTRFRRAFPAAFTSTVGTDVGGAASSAEPLSVVMTVVGRVFDTLLTEADRLRDVWDGRKIPYSLLEASASSLGMPIESHLGPKPQRALVTNAATIARMKGTRVGIEALASCLSSRDVLVTAGKNLVPTTLSSAYEKQTTFSTTLAIGVTSAVQTSIELSSVKGWPLTISHTKTYPRQVTLIKVVSATGTEIMRVVDMTGTTLTVTRGEHGTVAAASHAVGSAVTLLWSWHGWEVLPGYDVAVNSATDTGFAMPVATSSSPTQPPLQGYCLKITRVNNAGTIGTPELAFGVKRWVATYSRSGKVGTVTTLRPHELVSGQRVTAYFGSASATTPTATYSVLAVIDSHTFTVLHTETTLTDATMPGSDLTTATPPYVLVHPLPKSLVPVTATQTYTYSARVRAGTTGRGVQATVTWYNQYGVSISTATGTSVTDSNASWQTASVTATAPAGAVFAGLSMKYDIAAAWALSEAHYVTQHQMENAGAATGYDDGGLIRVGLNSSAEIDPYRTIRLRTRELLSTWASDARTYRVECLVRTLGLPTGSSYASLTMTAQSWYDIDFRIRLNPTSLATTQKIVTLLSGAAVSQCELDLTTTALTLYLNTAGVPTTVTSSAHGLTAGQAVWLRVVRVASTGAVTFYKAADSENEPYAWTQISTHANTAGNLGATTTNVVVGSTTTGGLVGSIHYCRFMMGTSEPVDLNPWLWDSVRNIIPNGGTAGILADWVLSSAAPNAVVITTTWP